MSIKSFPFGIPFSSSFSVSASYTPSASVLSTPTASLAEFVSSFIGPTGATGKTIDNAGQFVYISPPGNYEQFED